MGTYVILAVLVIIVIAAIFGSKKHFKGEGGCCGGGSGEIRDNKKLEGSVIAQRIVRIEGMHCEHCQNSVERSINKIDGAAARVNLKKGVALVSLDREVSDDVIKAAVENEGFTVTAIEVKG